MAVHTKETKNPVPKVPVPTIATSHGACNETDQPFALLKAQDAGNEPYYHPDSKANEAESDSLVRQFVISLEDRRQGGEYDVYE